MPSYVHRAEMYNAQAKNVANSSNILGQHGYGDSI